MGRLIGLDGREVSTEQVIYSTHANVDYRPATCEEIGCAWMRSGWATIVDPTTDLGGMQADYIRTDKTRTHIEWSGAAWNERGLALAAERNAANAGTNAPLEEFESIGNAMTVFEFRPGTECFNRNDHVTTQAVNPLFLVRDHAGQVIREHSGVDPFLNDFREHSEPQFHHLRERMGERNG